MSSAETAVAHVIAAGHDHGLAFFVGDRLVVTCAHVVNLALGRDKHAAATAVGEEVELDFRYAGKSTDKITRTARVEAWLPDLPGCTPQEFDLQDVAVLRLREDLPADASALKIASSISQARPQITIIDPAHHLYLPKDQSGRLSGYVPGTLAGKADKGRRHLDLTPNSTFRAAPGCSGGPVWLTGTRTVVAMFQVVSTDDDATHGFALTTDVLRQGLDKIPQSAPSRRWPFIAAPLAISAAIVAFLVLGNGGHSPDPLPSPGPTSPHSTASAVPPCCSPTPRPTGGHTVAEIADNRSGTPVYRDPQGGSVGADIPARIAFNTPIQVRCKVPNTSAIRSVSYWYLLDTPPWQGAYAPSDTFANGDTVGEPGTHNVDPAVPDC